MAYLERIFETADENVTIPNPMTFSGAITFTGSTSITATAVAPSSDDGQALGSTILQWSDAFLASGGVINWNNGNITLTHSAALLTLAGGPLAVSDATDSTSGATGAIHNAGGLGITKALFVGTTSKLTGAVSCEAALGMLDDMELTIGTTVTNAATKLTMEFDETTTGIGQVRMGDLSNAQVLNTNPGATVVGHVINIEHSAGAGDCTDLMGLYIKNQISGDGDSGTTLVPLGIRAYIAADAVADEVYAIQPWIKHSGTGTIQAGSAVSAALVLNDSDAFTATNSLNAGHFHIKTYAGEANGTVTSSNFDGVLIEVYGNVTGLDSLLHLTNAGTGTDSIIKATPGTAVNVLEFSAAAASVVEDTGTYSTADAYMIVKVGNNTYRSPLFTAVD